MHVLCLVSDQPMPNFLPIRAPELKIKKVTLAVTPQMENQARWFRQVLSNYPDLTITEDCKLEDGTNFKMLTETFMKWIDAQNDAEDLCLNVTGGTKPMAIVAQECFRMAGKKVFYVDIKSDQAIWLDLDETCELVPVHLTPSIKIERVLELNGYKIEEKTARSTIPLTWKHFVDVVGNDITRWKKLLPTLNAAISRANGKLEVSRYCSEFLPNDWELVEQTLEEAKLTLPNEPLHFRSRGAMQFAQADWLEYYVFRILKDMGFKKETLLQNVIISSNNGEIRNEFDVVLLHKNSLYILECKNRNLRRVQDGVVVADNAIYKVAELASRQGLRSTGVLVTPHAIRPEDRKRAEAFNVRVYDDFAKLREAFAKDFA